MAEKSLERRFRSIDGPLMEESRDLAKAIYKNLAEMEQLSGEQGQIEQNKKAEEYEWCRLCALIIEEEMRVWKV